jgi:hypothetical protein
VRARRPTATEVTTPGTKVAAETSRAYDGAIRRLERVIVNLERQLRRVRRARLILLGHVPVPDTKVCPKCPAAVGPQPADNFNRNRGKADGLQTICKACQADTFQRHVGRGALTARDFQEMERRGRNGAKSEVSSAQDNGELDHYIGGGGAELGEGSE